MKRVNLTLFSAFTIGILFTIGTPRVELLLKNSSGSFSEPKKGSPTKLVQQSEVAHQRKLEEFLTSSRKSIRLPRDITNKELGQFSSPEFSKVKEVYFQNCSVNESGLKYLRNLPVEKLSLIHI